MGGGLIPPPSWTLKILKIPLNTFIPIVVDLIYELKNIKIGPTESTTTNENTICKIEYAKYKNNNDKVFFMS